MPTPSLLPECDHPRDFHANEQQVKGTSDPTPERDIEREVLEVQNLTAPGSLRTRVVFPSDSGNPIVFELQEQMVPVKTVHVFVIASRIEVKVARITDITVEKVELDVGCATCATTLHSYQAPT